MRKTDFDIVIVGGGMVGAACAALLRRHEPTASLRVAMLEPHTVTPPAPDEPPGLRVSAISRAGQCLLQVSGAWQRLPARAPSAYRRMVVWDESSRPGDPGSITFDAAGIGEPDLGHIIENRAVQAALTTCAVHDGVELLQAGIEALTSSAGAVQLQTSTGQLLSAGLVVAADGGDSAVRRLAGIETHGRDYQQQAVVAHLQPQASHHQTAWQRFLATGPLALLPLADGRVSLVWSTRPDHAAQLLAMSDAGFGAAVSSASDRVLGALELTTERAAFPLRLMHAGSYSAARLVLIGDAAHGVHPLAGQGVNLGLMDCATLVQVLGEAAEQGIEIGDSRPLRRYERWRKAENLPAMALMDGLQRLFSNDDARLSWLRRNGLSLVDRSATLKRSLMLRAMGLAGEVPALARPPRPA